MTQLPDTTTEAGQCRASRMLARLIPDWSVHNDWQITTPEGYGLRNLYKLSEMAQAWKVLNWASENVPHFSKWWHDIAVVTIQDLPPAALSIFLCDNILRLADEAGMIEVNQ